MQTIIRHTSNWLQNVVIGMDFCPFAKREWLRNSIRFEVLEEFSPEILVRTLLSEFQLLDQDGRVATTLLILPNMPFEDYLDMLAFAEGILEELGYQGTYQLASFHPDYLFEGSEADDPANFTNRSPYPMFHILREEMLENALENYPNPEAIPERNVVLARDKGLDYMRAFWLRSFVPKP